MRSALLAMPPVCVAQTFCPFKRPAADGCAEDVACPVSAVYAVEATAPGATWAWDPIFAFGRASTVRLCRQVRILLTTEPREVRQPARLESRKPAAPSSRLLSHACGIRIGEDKRGAIPPRTQGSRPPNRGRRRQDTTARAAQRVRRCLLLLRGSSSSLLVRRARSGSLRRGGGAALVTAAPIALFFYTRLWFSGTCTGRNRTRARPDSCSLTSVLCTSAYYARSEPSRARSL
jgi:hypothetical protein